MTITEAQVTANDVEFACLEAGAGHFLHLEKPAEVDQLILDFIAR